MDVRQVDPRDVLWERSNVMYRVSFTAERGATDEFEMSGAELEEVLVWARSNRRGRTFTVYVVVDDGADGRGLLELLVEC